MPLLNGFIGEFTILQGVFEVPERGRLYAACAVVGIVLGAAYLLWLYQRVMFGPVTNPANANLPDLNTREFACLVPLVLAAFWIGVYPQPVLRYLKVPADQLVQRVNPNYFDQHPGLQPAGGPAIGKLAPISTAPGAAIPAAPAGK
jgi:NADH-quinone oxidoreductase subunit M